MASREDAPRVLHIVESFEAGSKGVILDLVRGSGLRHTVLAGLERSVTAGEALPVEVIAWHGATREISPHQDLLALRHAVEVIRRLRPDVIHCHSSKGGAVGRLAAALTGRRGVTVYTPHGVAFLRQDIGGRKRALYAGLEYALQYLCAYTVACSRSEQRALAQRGVRSLLIENGVEEPVSAARPEPRSPGGPLRVCTVGRLDTQKNPRLFEEIARELEGEEAEFLWIGSGEQSGEIGAANARVLGWLPKPQVAAVVGEADLYLSTSLWEGLPLAVLEAMALGKPLLLHDCPGNTDLVEPGQGGFLYRGAEQAAALIRGLLRQPERLAELGRASQRRWARDFTAERMHRRYHGLYAALINRDNPREDVK